MVNRFDLEFIIKQTLATVYKKIDLAKILLVLYINLYLLYQSHVQLGITTERQLIIDIMALWSSYKGKEIDKTRWICDKDNPVNAMTKASPNSALERLITINKVTIRLERWVKQ